MKNKFFAMFDYLLILIILVLVSMSVMFIYSSSINSKGVSVTNEYIKQIIWASIGFIIMIGITVYDYRKFESISLYLYAFLILLLIYTRIFGRFVNGAKSWIGIGEFGIQPSEFGKVFFIVFLARVFVQTQNFTPFKRFAYATAALIVPMGLILIQPDLGTASVYIPIYLVMCFIAGVPLTYIMYVFSLGMLTILFAILPVWNNEIAVSPHIFISIFTNMKLRIVLTGAILIITLVGYIIRRYLHGQKYIFWISYAFSIIAFALIFSLVLGKVLKDYQIKRLIIFMDPNKDPLGAGWNIIQSKVAIGAGGLLGQGYLMGTQSHYRFLPQQSTDFIFSILSEEFGFLGGCVVFILYFLILLKILYIIRKCSNKYGMYICAGIFGMFSFHFFINVGMVMGIMPITGIPLLFLSYGGSSLLTAMSCIGLLMNINYRKADLK
ncbi:rod shape-determining protein RodA [Treponema sp. Marseille-Q3903]|uniref:rod shape-determining protein RodA n=1 Tax=Treponema sp. Marseille-Q3903 TaxID=2766703 RepID=UPI0016522212|nr:rod shape-determining protein RodA [Treponema sp. Marseille-Q3903]MBC6713553.1 rod shape-determining protein RodA [Treponema sp. Marseille-Q3903]